MTSIRTEYEVHTAAGVPIYVSDNLALAYRYMKERREILPGLHIVEVRRTIEARRLSQRAIQAMKKEAA